MFRKRQAIVIGPTPPGTGVIAEAFFSAWAKLTSPTNLFFFSPSWLTSILLMPKYAEAIYNGLWFSSERIALQNLIDSTQVNVNGDVKLKLFKGNVIINGRRSPNSKYDLSMVSFDEKGDYDQRDAEGFIKINSLRLKNFN